MDYKRSVVTKVECPSCKKVFSVKSEPITPEDLGISSELLKKLQEEDPQMSALDYSPVIRASETGLKPSAAVFMYKITSEDIKNFIVKNADSLAPGVKVEIATRYCERKKRSSFEPRRSYASFRIAFSSKVIDTSDDYGWYSKIGKPAGKVKILKDPFNYLIAKYKYDQSEINSWLSSYKLLEELEEAFGMTEAYINDIKRYCVPQAVRSGDEDWVIFSAAPENIIRDMLSNPASEKVDGTIKIQDIYPISKDIVEFLVYVYPKEVSFEENAHVRAIIAGDKKN